MVFLKEKIMSIHEQNRRCFHGYRCDYSTMDLNPAYAEMVWMQSVANCPEADVVDARAMHCGI